MRTLKLRPTFSISLKTDSNVAWARIQETVDSLSEEIQGQFRGHHAIIAIVEKNRHFWSPWLNLEIRKAEKGEEIHGRVAHIRRVDRVQPGHLRGRAVGGILQGHHKKQGAGQRVG